MQCKIKVDILYMHPYKVWSLQCIFTFPADEGSFAQSTLRILHQVVF